MAESDAASSVDTSLAPSTLAISEPLMGVKMKIMEGMESMCARYGGPVQYLTAMLRDSASHVEFLDHLTTAYPESEEHLYTSCAKLPPVSDGDLGAVIPLCVHVAVLGFDVSCSLKPPPGHARTLGLAEQYVVDGFCSQGDPLLLVQSRSVHDIVSVTAPWTSNDPTQDPITPFSVGYLKGMGRASVLLSMLHWCWKGDIDLRKDHPVLAKSVATIFVHHAQQSSRIEECLQNMKHSSRGSLRKMTNIIEVCFMIKGLLAFGLNDFASFVKRWNMMSVKSHQIVGKRAMALKLLFESAPKACAL